MTEPKLSFAKAYEELQKILTDSETDSLDLEKSIARYKRAGILSKFLKTELTKMEKDIEEISLDAKPETTRPEPAADQTDIPF